MADGPNYTEMQMAKGLKKGQTHAGSFKPGHAANPGGRPKLVSEVRDLARQYTTESIDALARIMRDPNSGESAVVAAANALLDRGWGKAPQTITVRRIEDMSDAELDAYIADRAIEAGISIEGHRGNGRANGSNGSGNGSGGLSGIH